MRPPAARLAAGVLAVAAVGWLAAGAARAFDQERHARAAQAVVTAPDRVTHLLAPEPGWRAGDARGRFEYRPGGWLSVVTLERLPPLPPEREDLRYLVFFRQLRRGWVLAGAARPGLDGTAVVRFGSEPEPAKVMEVVVTRGVDAAGKGPRHGEPVLHWMAEWAVRQCVPRFDGRLPRGAPAPGTAQRGCPAQPALRE